MKAFLEIVGGILLTIVLVALFIGPIIAVGIYEDSRDKAKHRAEFEREAIEHGAGEYVIVDKETGATEFRWTTTENEP